ncbi:hypothetical protein JCM10212_001763 [Sporobolomyces blumeae]
MDLHSSPLRHIACSKCHRDFLSSATSTSTSPRMPFYLSSCFHSLCHSCLFHDSTPPNDLAHLRVPCPACSTQTSLALLAPDDPTNDLSLYFRPLPELLSELGMATQWQVHNLVDQVSYLKPKCIEQKKLIARLTAELKKVKAYKLQIERVSAENASLRAQIAASDPTALAPASVSIQPGRLQPTRDSEANAGWTFDPNGDGLRTSKRKAVEDAPRDSAPVLRPSTSTSHYPRSNASGLPHSDHDSAVSTQIRPERLSLTSSARARHSDLRGYTDSVVPRLSADLDVPVPGVRTSEVVQTGFRIPDGGTGQRGDAEVVTGGRTSRIGASAKGYLREHLSHFAYTPSRVSHRSDADSHAPVVPPFHGAPPPGPSADPDRSASPPLARPTSSYAGSQTWSDARDAEEMPPPPVPTHVASRGRRPFVPPVQRSLQPPPTPGSRTPAIAPSSPHPLRPSSMINVAPASDGERDGFLGVPTHSQDRFETGASPARPRTDGTRTGPFRPASRR